MKITIALLLVLATTAGAQETEPVEPQPLTEEKAAELQSLYDAIGEQRDEIGKLEKLVATSDGEAAQWIYGARLNRAWVDLLEDGDRFAQAVIDAKNAGDAPGEFETLAKEVLQGQGEIGGRAWQRMRDAAELPGPEASAAERAAAYAKVFEVQRTTDRIFDTYLKGLTLAGEIGLDMSADTEVIEEVLAERALNVSVFLELSVEQANGLKAGLAALPDDAELKAKVAVADDVVRESAQALQRVVDHMESLGARNRGVSGADFNRDRRAYDGRVRFRRGLEPVFTLGAVDSRLFRR